MRTEHSRHCVRGLWSVLGGGESGESGEERGDSGEERGDSGGTRCGYSNLSVNIVCVYF